MASLDQLATDSDLVVIVRAIDTTPTDDLLEGRDEFQGFNTRFSVLAVLKTTAEKPENITLLHFGFSRKGDVIINGPTFMSFVTTPISFDRPENLIPGRHQKGYAFKAVPLYVAFLKKRKDGRFEPTGGQNYSDFSFRVLEPWRSEIFEASALEGVPGLPGPK